MGKLPRVFESDTSSLGAGITVNGTRFHLRDTVTEERLSHHASSCPGEAATVGNYQTLSDAPDGLGSIVACLVGSRATGARAGDGGTTASGNCNVSDTSIDIWHWSPP